MNDFKNNKDSKLKEIKVGFSAECALADDQADIAKRKKEVGVRTLEVKSRQKASQTAELELRKCFDELDHRAEKKNNSRAT